jgi:hypothetical protein
MVKVILEKEDLLKIIQHQYKDAQYVTKLDEEFEITISIPNFQPVVASPVVAQETTVEAQAPEHITKLKEKINLNGSARTESTLTPAQRAINEKTVKRDDSNG